MRLVRRRTKENEGKGDIIAHCLQSKETLTSEIAPLLAYRKLDVCRTGKDVAGGAHMSIFRLMADAVQMSKMHWCLADQSQKLLTIPEGFYLGTEGDASVFHTFAAGKQLF